MFSLSESLSTEPHGSINLFTGFTRMLKTYCKCVLSYSYIITRILFTNLYLKLYNHKHSPTSGVNKS